MLGFDQFLFDFCFLKLLFILKNKENKKNRENTFGSIFFFLNIENNKSFQKKKTNQIGLWYFLKNYYYSLNLLFFILPIIFITIKRKGNHIFFQIKREKEPKVLSLFFRTKNNFQNYIQLDP